MMKKFKFYIKNNLKNVRLLFSRFVFKNNFKFVMLTCLCFFLVIVLVCCRFVPALLANSVYNISDLNSNLGTIRVGDRINYEVNGYSDWRVLSIDKENGTIDVTSNNNVYDLAIEPNKTVDEYKEIFQAEADKFNDGKYVINSRTIAKSDSLMFDTTGEYWLGNVNENSLMTNKTGSQETATIVTQSPVDVNTIYVLPYFELEYNDRHLYVGPPTGTIINLPINGINSWIYKGEKRTRSGSVDKVGFIFQAASPVALTVNGLSDMDNTVNAYLKSFDAKEISNSILNSNFEYLYEYDKVLKFGFLNAPSSLLDTDIFDSNEFVYYYNYYGQWRYGGKDNDVIKRGCIEKRYHIECDSSQLIKFFSDGTSETVSYKYLPKTLTFGYRPVLTLKVDNNSSGKTTEEILNIGDHVKYEANGYRNWKVLSINENDGTVDIISGGIVKNLSLYGMNDYENYETILQNEVDSYKNGSNVISARAVSADDVNNLIKMNDKVAAMYWFNQKFKSKVSSSLNLQTSSNTDGGETFNYGVGILWTNTGDYYVNNLITSPSSTNIRKYWVKFYSQNDSFFQYYIGGGNQGFIAGLRPIITLKYDSVNLLSDKQAKKLDSISQDYDKYYTNEQLNSFYKGGTGTLFNGDGDNTDEEVSITQFNVNQQDYYDLNAGLNEISDTFYLGIFLAILYFIITILLFVFVVVYFKKKSRGKVVKFI